MINIYVYIYEDEEEFNYKKQKKYNKCNEKLIFRILKFLEKHKKLHRIRAKELVVFERYKINVKEAKKCRLSFTKKEIGK